MIRRKKSGKPKLAQIVPDLMQVYQYFWQDIRLQSKLIFSSFAALLLGIVFRLLEPWPLKFVLDRVFNKTGDSSATTITLPENWSTSSIVLFVAMAVVVIAVVGAITDYSSQAGFFKIGNFMVIRVRDRVYRHLQALPLAFHDQARHGNLITIVTRDVSLLRDVTATAILPLIGNSMALIGMTTVMLWLNWRLAAISLMIVPLYWLTTVRLGRQIRETARKQRQREGAMATIASEAISSIRAIKALGLEEKFAGDFDRKNNQSQTNDLKASRLSLKLGRTVDILLAISTAAVLWMGAKHVLGGAMSPGDLVVFLFYLKRSFKPAQEFAKYTARIAKATAAGERVISILERPIELMRTEQSVELGQVVGRIEFRNVCFGYNKEQLVLKDFSLIVEAGKTVAITGPSGIGKSTLLSLLLRFYQPQSGNILIDGQDIQDFSLVSLRAKFGVVLQSPLLFAASIRDNIALGNSNASEQELLKAARLAEVDEFVLEMPQLFDTLIGERSTTLSRGQQQRIAIARAALSDRPMLLLDEPTTGLDETNQNLISDSLFDLAKNKTTLMITHNLVMASRADEVAYIADGQVKQHGTHHGLMQTGGRYAQLWAEQRTVCAVANSTVAQDREA